MINTLKTRLAFGMRTAPVPKEGENPVALGFRGLPDLSGEVCTEGCSRCATACPTGAISLEGGLSLDLGKCTFCPECVTACPKGKIKFTNNHRLSATSREGLIIREGYGAPTVEKMPPDLRKLFGRSFKLRQVSAGGCNGCEAELIVTGTLVFDLSRFGVQFVASPRHADALLITGPVSKNMALALQKSYEALPPPKLVIACGACALSGGPFAGSGETLEGAGNALPVDLWIAGCPPHPWTIVDGILRLMGRI